VSDWAGFCATTTTPLEKRGLSFRTLRARRFRRADLLGVIDDCGPIGQVAGMMVLFGLALFVPTPTWPAGGPSWD
jgi:hypothetical protein